MARQTLMPDSPGSTKSFNVDQTQKLDAMMTELYQRVIQSGTVALGVTGEAPPIEGLLVDGAFVMLQAQGDHTGPIYPVIDGLDFTITSAAGNVDNTVVVGYVVIRPITADL